MAGQFEKIEIDLVIVEDETDGAKDWEFKLDAGFLSSKRVLTVKKSFDFSRMDYDERREFSKKLKEYFQKEIAWSGSAGEESFRELQKEYLRSQEYRYDKIQVPVEGEEEIATGDEPEKKKGSSWF